MSELLALSFDADTSPSITLKSVRERRVGSQLPFGWGFGWYPGNELASVVIKDPTSTGEDPMTSLLRDWERFRSTLFVCHVRGAAKRISQRDTQPLQRFYAARSWLFAHSGDLTSDYHDAFPLDIDSPFEPLGRTDSEHVFCWMLTELARQKARSLLDLDWTVLTGWLRRMSEVGSANILLSDGQHLVAYRCPNSMSEFHWLRRTPPHAESQVETEALTVALDNPQDPHRTGILFSTCPEGEGWTEMSDGQVILARGGEAVWSSGPGPATRVGVHKRLPDPGENKPRELRVVHETRYAYERPVERSSHRFRLKPVHDSRQEILHHQLQISIDGLQRNYEDVFGNHTTSLEVSEPFTELEIRSEFRVRVQPEDPLQLRSPLERDAIPLVWMPWQRQMMQSYLLPMDLPESQLRELSTYAMSFVDRNDYDLLETMLDINRTIYLDFEYVPGSTTTATTPFEVYEGRRGVCQDFANLMICMARLLSVPARYRMGYIFTGGGYENRIQSDASHAWVELYLPWVGWHGFDPTNGCQVNTDHVRVACGRNYVDATPTTGVLFSGGGTETLTTSVRVERD